MGEDSPDDGNFLVRVRAQVMTRDEYGWVPLGGGGLSNVSVRKRVVSEDDKKPEYVICGKRISDQTVVLSCTIKRDFQYNKVMPTFHHWRTGDKKFGLTFQTAADARAFDKGVRTAVGDLLEGVGYVHNAHGEDLGDDEVFMTVDLPVESHSSTGSSSESGGNGHRPPSADLPFSATSSPYSHPNLHRVLYMKPSRTMPPATTTPAPTTTMTTSVSAGTGDLNKKVDQDIWVKEKPDPHDKIESYSYVQFSKEKPRPDHDYCYPAIESIKGQEEQQPEKKRTVSTEPPLLPSKMKGNHPRNRQSPPQLRCRLCRETYTEEQNRPGNCRGGSQDRTLRLYNYQLSYSCRDEDGRCCRRWAGLALLSLCCPCIWCCPAQGHRGGVRGGRCCGGRHEPE